MTYESYQLFTFFWMALGAMVFLYLLRKNAPFGRHVAPGWGPTVDNRLAWVVMELTVLVSLCVFLQKGGIPPNWPVMLMLGLFTAHYIHRSLIFPFRLRTSGKRMPLVVMLSAVVFNSVNGYLLGAWFGYFANYSPDWPADPRFIGGTTLFFIGAFINIRSDNHLISLRNGDASGYKIPEKGLFRQVSCANLFGEILEWTGFALLTWSLPALAFLWWTIANLAPRARAHHQWYLDHFPEYPKQRKILIPRIW